MRILVLGGTRFIGLHTVRRLAAAGHEITVFHRGETEPDDLPDVFHIHGDRDELDSYRPAIAKLGPDVVLDMLPLNGPSAETVIRVVSGNAERVVAISSQDVYRAYGVFIGRENDQEPLGAMSETSPLRSTLFPYRESFPPDHPLHDYDKIPAERTYLGQPDTPGTVLRLPCVYGPNDAQHRLWPYLSRMLADRPAILLSGPMAGWRWTRGYVENIADSIALAIENGDAENRVYNIGEREALTEREWVERIAEVVGWSGEIVTRDAREMPTHLAADANYAQPLVADTSLIRSHLGYAETVDHDVGLRRTIAWERTHPPEDGSPDPSQLEAEDAVISS